MTQEMLTCVYTYATVTQIKIQNIPITLEGPPYPLLKMSPFSPAQR